MRFGARNCDYFQFGVGLSYGLNGLNAFLFRHDEIRNDKTDGRLAEKVHGRFAIGSFDHPVFTIFKQYSQTLPEISIIIDYQDGLHKHKYLIETIRHARRDFPQIRRK